MAKALLWLPKKEFVNEIGSGFAPASWDLGIADLDLLRQHGVSDFGSVSSVVRPLEIIGKVVPFHTYTRRLLLREQSSRLLFRDSFCKLLLELFLKVKNYTYIPESHLYHRSYRLLSLLPHPNPLHAGSL